MDHSSKHSEFVAGAVLRACVGAVTGVARVTVLGDVGYLFLRKGEIQHATTLDLEGEEAALAILGWEAGSFEICERRWPRAAPIGVPWRELFRRAKAKFEHTIDGPEPAAAPLSTQSSRDDSSPGAAAPEHGVSAPASGVSRPRAQTFKPVALQFAAALLDDQIDEWIHLAPNGSLAGERGGARPLARTIGRGLQYADEIGKALGAGEVQAVEGRAGEAACVLVRSGRERFAMRSRAGTALDRVRRACSL